MKTQSEKRMPYILSLALTSLLTLISETSTANNIPRLDISLPSTILADPVLLSEFELDERGNHATMQLAFSKKTSYTNILRRIQDRYLTIHYGKSEKIKADYQLGAYCIAYQHEW